MSAADYLYFSLLGDLLNTGSRRGEPDDPNTMAIFGRQQRHDRPTRPFP